MTTKASVLSSIASNLPSNGLGEISAADVRAELEAVANFSGQAHGVLVDENYAVTVNDQVVIVTEDQFPVQVTLPVAATMEGQVLRVKAMTVEVLVAPNGVETIDGEDGYTLSTAGQSVTLYSMSGSWYVL